MPIRAINDLVADAKRGYEMKMYEEYKDRGYNAAAWSRGCEMEQKAHAELRRRGFDDQGRRTKETMFDMGMELINRFCELNNFDMPDVNFYTDREQRLIKVCGYYRPQYPTKAGYFPNINVCLAKCAAVGFAGTAWSAPGYIVDRTPCGVLAHELGHHVDWCRGTVKDTYWSDYSTTVRAKAAEQQLTNYCPNDAEWFAEMMRLFITNPDLLRQHRPRTFDVLTGDGLKPVIDEPWFERLIDAPERTVVAAARKLVNNR